MTDIIYRTWAAGRCPCCQSDLVEWIDGTPPGAIGEGVEICGRCIANEHMLREGEEAAREAFLKAIVLRDDAPYEEMVE